MPYPAKASEHKTTVAQANSPTIQISQAIIAEKHKLCSLHLTAIF